MLNNVEPVDYKGIALTKRSTSLTVHYFSLDVAVRRQILSASDDLGQREALFR